MSDGIRSIHYLSQVKQISPKKRNTGRKDGKKGEQEFSEHISVSGGDERNKKNKKSCPDQKGAEGKEGLSRTDNLDVGCGTIIDVEA
jgi:hypothetical protein